MMTPARFDELRANAMSDVDLVSHNDVIELVEEIPDLASKVYVPGSYKCPKCNFRLVTNILYAKSGTIGVKHHHGDPCPNDGEKMIPVTWEEDAREMSAKMLQAVQMDRIDELRKNEGAAVTILCDNPEGPPNVAIEVCDEWTGWKGRRFEGERLIDCLNDAVRAKNDENVG